MTMKCILVEGPRRMRIEARAIPVPGAGEVRVRVRFAGICGSDLHIYHGDHPYVRFPRVIGHEFAGVIDATGPGIAESRIGERVAVSPVISCGDCASCRAGRPNVCLNLKVVGVHVEGGFAEYCCVRADLAHPVPDGVDDRAAATVEPFSIAANMLSRTGVLAQDAALVYGAGPIGMTVVQAFKGVHRVAPLVVADRLEERLARARESGADLTVNVAQEALPEVLAREGIAPSLIIDAACHPAILKEALEIAAPAGRIGLMGFNAAPSAVSQQVMNRKELTLCASRLNNRKFPEVIGWMADGRIDPARFISHTFPFTQVQDAFDLLESAPVSCSKILLDFTAA
ncbi:MAG: Zn-dependent oxidoreductase [Tropicimonas sp.]|uniref:Zn-dependent oxidoreductase n=1 Tax=Tropicimonas sp. TaxID=2067044 RepID=UPI003A8736EA